MTDSSIAVQWLNSPNKSQRFGARDSNRIETARNDAARTFQVVDEFVKRRIRWVKPYGWGNRLYVDLCPGNRSASGLDGPTLKQDSLCDGDGHPLVEGGTKLITFSDEPRQTSTPFQNRILLSRSSKASWIGNLTEKQATHDFPRRGYIYRSPS
jgi:hypothetical protein